MLRALVRFALRQRLLTLGLVGVLVIAGVRSFLALPIEAFPDVQDTQVQVITSWPGHAAEEIETYISLPVERALNGTSQLTNLRSVSIFGLSVVTVTFEDGAQDYFVRQQVLERLQGVTVPDGVQPSLAPLANALGEIYRYTLRGGLPLRELRALQDWVVEPAFRTVPGVVDVVGFGGAVKQYQVNVVAERLAAYGVTLPQVEQAIAAANANAGGGYLSHGWERQVIRGVGVFASLDDIRDVVVVQRNGVPVRVRDLGTVAVGDAPREGIVGKDDADDVIEGVVLARKGENALKVLTGVRAMAERLQATRLPAGVTLVPFYDRADLVSHTVDTVLENLSVGALLVLGILLVFLGSWRAALVVATVIPLSLLAAFVLMEANHVPANLISLGAVDFGLIVDAAVVMVEGFVVWMAAQKFAPVTGDTPAARRASQVARSLERREVLARVTELLGRPMLFSVTCVVAAFLPIFTFQRVERRIFSPMAYTLTFSLLASLLLSLTLIPVLASWALKGRTRAPDDPGHVDETDANTGAYRVQHAPDHDQAHETWATRAIHRAYGPMRDWALARRRTVIGVSIALLLAALALGTRLGTEFLPALDEGNIWLTVTMPVGIAPERAKAIERTVRGTLARDPAVRQVVGQLGRPEDGTDPKAFNNLEVLADLQPRSAWGGRSKEQIIDAMRDSLGRIPGLQLNFSQYIKDNVEEALSGVKGELVVKIYGPDLAVLQAKGEAVRQVLAGIRGVADLGVEQQFGMPQLRLQLDRAALSRYGLAVTDVNDAIETAVGGKAVTTYLEGERLFDVRVRFDARARDNLEALRELPIRTADGQLVPLGTVARIGLVEGASRISREMNERRVAIKCSVRGRDEGGFVAEAQKAVAEAVPMPPGYRLTWGGQFENQRRAQARLLVIVPVALLLIFLLLFTAFQSVRYATLILANVPFALIGGITMLAARGIHLSVAASVGFVALFGIAVQNGIVLLSEFKRLKGEGRDVEAAVREGTDNRLRPVLMTALMAMFGLLPAAFSTKVGAETTRPFASVIVGGLVTSTLLTLVLLPVLFVVFDRRPEAELPA